MWPEAEVPSTKRLFQARIPSALSPAGQSLLFVSDKASLQVLSSILQGSAALQHLRRDRFGKINALFQFQAAVERTDAAHGLKTTCFRVTNRSAG